MLQIQFQSIFPKQTSYGEVKKMIKTTTTLRRNNLKIVIIAYITLIFLLSLSQISSTSSPNPQHHKPGEIKGYVNLSAHTGAFLAESVSLYTERVVSVGWPPPWSPRRDFYYFVNASATKASSGEIKVVLTCCKSTTPPTSCKSLSTTNILFNSLVCDQAGDTDLELTLTHLLTSSGMILGLERRWIPTVALGGFMEDTGESIVIPWGTT